MSETTTVNLTPKTKYLVTLLARKWHVTFSTAIKICLKDYLKRAGNE